MSERPYSPPVSGGFREGLKMETLHVVTCVANPLRR